MEYFCTLTTGLLLLIGVALTIKAVLESIGPKNKPANPAQPPAGSIQREVQDAKLQKQVNLLEYRITELESDLKLLTRRVDSALPAQLPPQPTGTLKPQPKPQDHMSTQTEAATSAQQAVTPTAPATPISRETTQPDADLTTQPQPTTPPSTPEPGSSVPISETPAAGPSVGSMLDRLKERKAGLEPNVLAKSAQGAPNPEMGQELGPDQAARETDLPVQAAPNPAVTPGNSANNPAVTPGNPANNPSQPPANPAGARPIPPISPQASPQNKPSNKQPAQPVTLESLLSTKVFIWVAGIFLSLAGIYLVKYANEKGIFPVWGRLAAGAALGLIGMGIGEWLRGKSPRIASAVVGASLTTLFGVVLAGANLYEYIPKSVGFVFMALIALAAVFLSLRHGMLVAVLGLLGGYLTPALMSTGSGKAMPLAVYLVLLQCALTFVIRKMGWGVLGGVMLAATMVWSLIMLFSDRIVGDGLALAVLLVGTGIQYALVLDRPVETQQAGPENTGETPVEAGAQTQGRAGGAVLWPGSSIDSHAFNRWMGICAVGLGLFLMTSRVAVGKYAGADWVYLGVISAAIILLARFKQAYVIVCYLGLLSTLMLMVRWLEQAPAGDGEVVGGSLQLPDGTHAGWVWAGMSAVFVLGGFLASVSGPMPGRFATLSVAAAGLFFSLGWWFEVKLGLVSYMPWIAVLFSLFFTGWTVLVHVAMGVSRKREMILAATTVAASGFAMTVAPLWLSNWVVVCWAGQAFAMVILARHYRVPLLHGLGIVAFAAVFFQTTLGPDLWSKNHEQTGLLLWALVNYLPVIGLMTGATYVLYHDKLEPAEGEPALDPMVKQWLSVGASGLAGFAQVTLGMLLMILLRLVFHPEISTFWTGADFTASEVGCLLTLWLALLAVSQTVCKQINWLWNPLTVGLWLGLSVIETILLLTLYNPLFNNESVGAVPIFNGLMLLYLLPAGMYLLNGWVLTWRPEQDDEADEPMGRQNGRQIDGQVTQPVDMPASMPASPSASPPTSPLVGLLGLVYGLIALGLFMVFVTLEARWFFHDAGVLSLFQSNRIMLNFCEAATYVPLWLAIGCTLAAVGLWRVKSGLVTTGFAVKLATIFWIVFVLLIGLNPILDGQSVGKLFLLNGIGAGFLLPAAMLILATVVYQNYRHFIQAQITGWSGYALLFIGVSMSVRQYFHGEFIMGLKMDNPESYTYSAAWIILSLMLLAAGVLTGTTRPRYASLIVMIIAMIKVGYDVFLLQDLYRVASLFGMGVALLGLAFVYQKFVFRNQLESDLPGEE